MRVRSARPRRARVPPAAPGEPLTAELEAALVRALRAAWYDANGQYFKRHLKVPVIALSDAAGRLGCWLPEVRTIELGRAFVLAQAWGVVVEVLRHEMLHQYVHEVLGIRDQGAHGPAFRELGERLGIDVAARGLPRAADSAEGRVLGRIAKLLALADSPNVHEAESAMAEAQRLMLKHNLEVTRAGAARGYGFRHLGAPSGRVEESARLLAHILEHHFFVECIWVSVWRPREGRRGSVLEVCGSEANLEMAAYVHDFLTHTADRLWREYRRAHGVPGRERRTFQAGVMMGFRDKLMVQGQQQAERGLVWTGDADLGAYYRRRHPRVRWLHHEGNPMTAARSHGRAAGSKVVLSKPMHSGPSGSTRLLR